MRYNSKKWPESQPIAKSTQTKADDQNKNLKSHYIYLEWPQPPGSRGLQKCRSYELTAFYLLAQGGTALFWFGSVRFGSVGFDLAWQPPSKNQSIAVDQNPKQGEIPIGSGRSDPTDPNATEPAI